MSYANHMTRQRRGGFRSPQLGGTLGTLLRTTLAQAGAVRDALERGAREGRSRLDDALAGRRRSDALAELGEIVLDLIRRGEIDVAELPEVQDVVAHLDELDAGHAHEPDEDGPAPASSVRKRFDARSRADQDDGTVAATTWSRASKPRTPAKVWRPPAPADEEAASEIEPSTRPRPEHTASAPGRKGGISFDDEDLADYMHPDDVPPKKAPPDGDS